MLLTLAARDGRHHRAFGADPLSPAQARPMKLVLALLAATHTAAAFGPAGYRASHDPVSRFVPRSAVDECTIVFDADGAFCMEDSHMNRATALDCLATDECDVPEFQEGALRHQ